MSHQGEKSTFALLLAAGMLAGLMGCEDSVRSPVQVHPIEIAPQTVRESLPPLALPFDARRGRVTPLMVFAPDGIQWLAARTQAVFDAGEEDFRARRFGKARGEF